jgi:hypothetical protein
MNNYWIFRCDTMKYRLAERLEDANPLTTWRVNQHRNEIHAGDVAFIWANGKKGGIRARIRIDSEPSDMSEMDHELDYAVRNHSCDDDLDSGTRLRVTAIIEATAHLLPEEVKSQPGLEEMSIFTGYKQQTNYEITPEQGEILCKLPDWADYKPEAAPPR